MKGERVEEVEERKKGKVEEGEMVKIGGREVNKKDTVDVECMCIGRIRQLHHSKDTALHCIASLHHILNCVQ